MPRPGGCPGEWVWLEFVFTLFLASGTARSGLGGDETGADRANMEGAVGQPNGLGPCLPEVLPALGLFSMAGRAER